MSTVTLTDVMCGALSPPTASLRLPKACQGHQEPEQSTPLPGHTEHTGEGTDGRVRAPVQPPPVRLHRGDGGRGKPKPSFPYMMLTTPKQSRGAYYYLLVALMKNNNKL